MSKKAFEDGSLESGAGCLAIAVVCIFAAVGGTSGFLWGLLVGTIILVALRSGPADNAVNERTDIKSSQSVTLNYIVGSAPMLSKYEVNALCKLNLFPKGISNFVAIDFETANKQPHSACSLGLVVVRNGEITTRKSWLINPETKTFTFSYLHGITREMVKDAPLFEDIWPEIYDLIQEEYLVAHNMVFDYGVLQALARKYYSIKLPNHRLICSLEVARARISLPSYKLNHVCNHLNIELNHHDALSDAEAAAKIVLRLG